MEMQFEKNVQHCLRSVCIQQENQELTQDIRLSDGMPDIGRILGCWGQVLIRGKEWRGSSIGISGGTMVWVLYAPEDGSEVRSVESWIPFQMRMDIPETKRDGYICVCPRLGAMDARSTSARKMMVRTDVGVLVRVLENGEISIPVPPRDIAGMEILTMEYPMELPMEFGEKQLTIEDSPDESADNLNIGKILHYSMVPQLIEQKIMAGRLVFRGLGILHILYATPEGQIQARDLEIPFSQYAQLDREYGSHAGAWTTFMVTGLEVELKEGSAQIKATLAAQYEVWDRVMVTVAEDAYSLKRQIAPQMEKLSVPVYLDRCEDAVQLEQTINAVPGRIIEAVCQPELPICRQAGDTVQVELPGTVTVLCCDEQGTMRGSQQRFCGKWTMRSDPGNQLWAESVCTGEAACVPDGEGMRFSTQLMVRSCVRREQELEAISGLQIGEERKPDPTRPSIILCRAGNHRLWDIAKSCGSTVDAIRQANKLQQEPAAQQMLLIPVE